MQKILLFAITYLFLFLNSFAQIKYEEGYFINNGNQKISCSIKNSDWKNNPTEFYYKLSENSEIVKASIENIKEFGIINEVKYKRFVVDIDRSSDLTKSVSNVKKPIFNNEKLLLKVLVEGTATLYSYRGINLKRFFFSTDNRIIEQLVYKKHLTSNNSVGENNYYKQQLSNNLKCKNITFDRFESIEYEQKALINLFVEFNECGNFKYHVFSGQNKDYFHLSIRPGINSSNFSMKNLNSVSNDLFVFTNNLSFRIGLEAEYILPFNNKKWAIIIEPTYNYYKSEIFDNYAHAIADIKSIDIPIGVRHYLFLNKDSKLFINTSFLTGIGFNSAITIDGYLLDTSQIRNNMVFGFGYKYKKYCVEFKYDTKSDVFDKPWVSNYNRTSIVIGYNIF